MVAQWLLKHGEAMRITKAAVDKMAYCKADNAADYRWDDALRRMRRFYSPSTSEDPPQWWVDNWKEHVSDGDFRGGADLELKKQNASMQ